MKNFKMIALSAVMGFAITSCGDSSEEINDKTEAKTESTATKEVHNLINMLKENLCEVAFERATGQAIGELEMLMEQGCTIKELEGETTVECIDDNENASTCTCNNASGQFTIKMVKEDDVWMASELPNWSETNGEQDAMDQILDSAKNLIDSGAAAALDYIQNTEDLKADVESAIDAVEEFTK